MKILIGLLTVLAALAAAAFAFNYNGFDRQDAPDLPFRREAPSAPRAHITCFSGGKVILDDFTTGDIDISDSGAIRFRSHSTGQTIRTRSDCVAVYGARRATAFQPVLP